MYNFLQNLLSDKKGGEIFTLFSGWHYFYIALTLVAIFCIFVKLARQEIRRQERYSRGLINIAFGIYIADFFLMPLAYGEIDIEKLPFHACTAMCVLCFLSYRISFLEKYRTSFVLLGFISNIVYLIYPAGVMWHAVHPLSYRVIQTLLFHSIMTVYGAITLTYERERIELKKCYRDLVLLAIMTAWALLGNYAYNGESEGYSHFFNWFFVVRDPFYILPESVAPYVMPFLNIAIFFVAEIFVILCIMWVKRAFARKSSWRTPYRCLDYKGGSLVFDTPDSQEIFTVIYRDGLRITFGYFDAGGVYDATVRILKRKKLNLIEVVSFSNMSEEEALKELQEVIYKYRSK